MHIFEMLYRLDDNKNLKNYRPMTMLKQKKVDKKRQMQMFRVSYRNELVSHLHNSIVTISEILTLSM